MDETGILLGQIQDKIYRSQEYLMITYSDFLDLFQRSKVEAFLQREYGGKGLFYGGYKDAERTRAFFLPEYLGSSMEEMERDFKENNEDCPLLVLRVKAKPGGRELKHGDYLGSLMAEGIKREKVGDIIVRDGGADIIVDREMGEYLLRNYSKAGRVQLSVSLHEIGELIQQPVEIKEIRDTVASMRLDNMVATAFGISRGKAAEAIKMGIVFVNSRQNEKIDSQIKEGDKLVLRGKGKCIVKEISGTTRKGRIFVTINRYM